MKSASALMAGLIVAAGLAVGCSREPAGLEIQPGSDVSLEKNDGVTVTGRLVEVQAQEVVLQRADGQVARVPRSQIRALRVVTPVEASGSPAPRAPDAPAAPAPPAADGPGAEPRRARETPPTPDAVPSAAAPAPERLPEYRDVTVPAGTSLSIELTTAVGSSTSKVEDPVRGTLRRPIVVDGIEAIPAGTIAVGTVTDAAQSGRVKGLARVAFRFASLDLPGDAERLAIRTGSIVREAQPTKKKDAAKIGGAAAAGAVIGGIIGGGDGAAKGAAIGGGAGTGVVLSTRGQEVTLPAGTTVTAKLTAPVTVKVR